MELKQYLGIVKKKLWLIMILPLIAAGASYYISFYVLPPVFESGTTLYIANRIQDTQLPIAYNDILVSQQFVRDYRELIKSRSVTSTVIEELKLEHVTSDTLVPRISVNSKNDTRIIEIKVQDGDPKRAQQITDKLSSVFIARVAELMKVENIGIVDKAQLPYKPVKPRPVIIILTSVFTSILLAFGIAILTEYLDDTIKTSEDVEKQLGLSVLGTIPALGTK